MEKIKIGKITNAVGLKGEVKVYNYSYQDRFDDLDSVYVALKGGEVQQFHIQNRRYQKNMVILKFEEIQDRNSAEKLKECEIFIGEDQLRELPEGTFYIKDLIGFSVIEIKTGKEIGKLKDVLQNTAQDIYQIEQTNGKEALVPAVKEFVKEIKPKEKVIKLDLIPGFLDGDENED